MCVCVCVRACVRAFVDIDELPPPTCSGFDCSWCSGFDCLLRAHPSTITCADNPCQANECCTIPKLFTTIPLAGFELDGRSEPGCQATTQGDTPMLSITTAATSQSGTCFADLTTPTETWVAAIAGTNYAAANGGADFSKGYVEFPGPANTVGGVGSGYIEYPFECTAATTASWKLRVVTTDANSDSARLQVDDVTAAFHEWHLSQVGTLVAGSLDFEWSSVSREFSVGAGQHSLFIAEREDRLYVDRLEFVAGATACGFSIPHATDMSAETPVRISFEMYCGDGSGADGMCMNMGGRSLSGVEEAGVSAGVSLCFDTYNTDAGVDIFYDGAVVWQDLAPSGNSPPVSLFEDSTWHTVILDISPAAPGAWVSFSFDGESYGARHIFIESYTLPAPAYLGFSGRTGGLTNNHWARNIHYATAQNAQQSFTDACWHFSDIASVLDDSCAACSRTVSAGCNAATCAPGHFGFQTSTFDACGSSFATVTHEDVITIQDYTHNAECEWLVTCVTAPVELSFSSFEVEMTYDFLTVFDGNDASAPQLDRLTGNHLPTLQISTGSTMYLRFTSDGASIVTWTKDRWLTLLFVLRRVGFSTWFHCDGKMPEWWISARNLLQRFLR
eukprot:COSAG02_NODE_3909_length_6056_cov_3.448884_3_plen_617_part_00